jgi:hypothetical protein
MARALLYAAIVSDGNLNGGAPSTSVASEILDALDAGVLATSDRK